MKEHLAQTRTSMELTLIQLSQTADGSSALDHSLRTRTTITTKRQYGST